jgi:hypothetical protein
LLKPTCVNYNFKNLEKGLIYEARNFDPSA